MRGMQRRLSLALVAISLAVVAACVPRSSLLEGAITDDLRAGAESGQSTFDHSRFDSLLSTHSRVEQGRVDYSGLAQDGQALAEYVGSLGSAQLRNLPRAEQKALLINAYNAFTLTLILENHPAVESIRDLRDPWGQSRWILGGHTVSLDEIEHGLLRPLYRDPRVHFALNCASVGCPPLRDRAFVAAELNGQLDAAATGALARPQYAHIDDGKLALTSILKWFGDDFTDPGSVGSASTVQRWAARYAPGEVSAFVGAADSGPPIRWIDYDWTLNDVAPSPHQ